MSQIIASKDTSFTRFWFLTVDPECSGKVSQRQVSHVINTVLMDPRGWSSHGYKFAKISSQEGLALRKKALKHRRYIFHVKVSTNGEISRNCGFSGLSCADMSINVIFINLDRWLYGAKASGLSLDDYRSYLIQHEIGHLLGRNHTKCPTENYPRPIMVQATIANDTCKPNIWPLSEE